MQDPNVELLIRDARKILHDMNQPLTVIMARSELLLMHLAPDDPNRRSLDQINEQSEKLSRLIEELRAHLHAFAGED